jgi:hypothetical protein
MEQGVSYERVITCSNGHAPGAYNAAQRDIPTPTLIDAGAGGAALAATGMMDFPLLLMIVISLAVTGALMVGRRAISRR